jgi:hypothetical protein
LSKRNVFDCLRDLLTYLRDFHRDNNGLLRMIEFQKQPYLFSSAQLLEILTATTSVKTRIAIIQSIGPRLTDPQAKKDELMGLFRYAEEKLKVEEVLKNAWTRVSQQQQQAAMTASGAGGNLLSSKGGRGGGGPGRGAGPSSGRNVAAPMHSRASAGPSFAAFVNSKVKLSELDEKALSLDDDGSTVSFVRSSAAEGNTLNTEMDAALSSRESTGTPGPDEEESKVTPKRKTLVINKRPVTVKLASEIAQEKIEAEILAAANAAAGGPASASKKQPGSSGSNADPAGKFSSKSLHSQTSTPVRTTPGRRGSLNTPKTIAELMKAAQSPGLDGVSGKSASQADRHPHDHEDEAVNDEINTVLKMLDMDKTRADSASTDLEVWEMLVVTNRTMVEQFDKPVIRKTVSAPSSSSSRRLEREANMSVSSLAASSTEQHGDGFSATPSRYSSSSSSPRTLGQKRLSFQFYTGVFSAAKSAYAQALESLNHVNAQSNSGGSSDIGSNPGSNESSEHSSSSTSVANATKVYDQIAAQFSGGAATGLDIDSDLARCVHSPKHQVIKVGDLRRAFHPRGNERNNIPFVPTSPTAASHASNGSSDKFTISSPGRAGSISVSKLYKDAARPSFALGMDPESFLAMIEEQPIETNSGGFPQFTYKELVRKNFSREYGGLVQTDLEMYLNDKEFAIQFGMKKV